MKFYNEFHKINSIEINKHIEKLATIKVYKTLPKYIQTLYLKQKDSEE